MSNFNVIKMPFVPLDKKSDKIIIDSDKKTPDFLLKPSSFSPLKETLSKEEEGKETSQAIEEALKEQAAVILDRAREEADRIKEQAEKEANILKQEIFQKAKEDGYKDGYQSGVKAIKEEQTRFQQERAKEKEELKETIASLEPQFAELTIRFVEKLTGILADEQKGILLHLLREGLKGAEPSKHYILHVPEKAYEEVLLSEEDLKGCVGSRAEFEITADASLKGMECTIETDSCMIDASLTERMKGLKRSIRLLAESRE